MPSNNKQFPTMWINPEIKDILSFTGDNFELRDYDSDPHIKASVSV